MSQTQQAQRSYYRTVKEVAGELRVSGSHIRELCKEPDAPMTRVGQTYRILWPDFLAWLKRRNAPDQEPVA